MSISLTAPSSLSLDRADTRSRVHHRPDVDGLRAIAILAVVGFHAAPGVLPGGFAGVDVFFVISGYLITGIVVRDLERGTFSLAHFYARRVRRIFPALVVVLAAVWFVGWLVLLPDEYRRLGTALAAGAGFAANLAAYQDFGAYFYSTQQQPLVHLWSLGVEEQFYLVWPLLLLAIWKYGKAALLLLGALTIASFLGNVATVSLDTLGAFYLPWNRLWELSMGGLLACAQTRHTGSLTKLERWIGAGWLRMHGHHVAGVVGLALISGSLVGLRGTLEFPGGWAAIPTVGSLLLIAAGPDSWVNRNVLSLRWMVFIGLISYPWYLWHWPLLAFSHVTEGQVIAGATATLCLGASFILAYLTYKYIESPIRSSPHASHRVAILCCTLAGYLILGVLIAAKALPSRQLPTAALPLVTAATEDWLPGTGRAWTPFVDELIVLGDESRQVLFLGDSHLQQYYPRIERVLATEPATVKGAVFAVRGACPPLAELAHAYGSAGCRKHIEAALDYARRPSVDAIVLGAAWHGYLVKLEDGQYVLQAGAEESLDGLRQLIASLRARGKRVYLLLPSPISGSFDPRRMIRRTLLPPGFEIQVPAAPTRAGIEARMLPIASRLEQLAAESGAEMIDPMKFLCTDTACPFIAPGGEFMYHDGGHLNPSFTRRHISFLDHLVLDRRGHEPTP